MNLQFKLTRKDKIILFNKYIKRLNKKVSAIRNNCDEYQVMFSKSESV